MNFIEWFIEWGFNSIILTFLYWIIPTFLYRFWPMRSSLYFPPDLSTLANVVTTLATMDKKGSTSPVSSDEDNGITNGAADMEREQSQVARAFDTLAKAAQPSRNSSQVSNARRQI